MLDINNIPVPHLFCRKLKIFPSKLPNSVWKSHILPNKKKTEKRCQQTNANLLH